MTVRKCDFDQIQTLKVKKLRNINPSTSQHESSEGSVVPTQRLCFMLFVCNGLNSDSFPSHTGFPLRQLLELHSLSSWDQCSSERLSSDAPGSLTSS